MGLEIDGDRIYERKLPIRSLRTYLIETGIRRKYNSQGPS